MEIKSVLKGLRGIVSYFDADDTNGPVNRAIPAAITEIERLTAANRALNLALDMIACGAARIETSGTLQEFCFNGLRYVVNNDWPRIFEIIGWDKAAIALNQEGR